MEDQYIFDFSNLNDEFVNTLTTLSNGYIAVRGDYEFIKSKYGSIIAGVYGYVPFFYRELVNLPRITPIGLIFEGESLNPSKISKIKRILNVYEGVLEHGFEWKTRYGTIEYRSLRFVHKNLKNLFAMKVRVKSKDAKGRLFLRSFIDLETYNRSFNDDILIKVHKLVKSEKLDNSYVMNITTNDNKYSLNFCLINKISKSYESREESSDSNIGDNFYLEINEGEEIELIKYVLIDPSIGRLRSILKKLEESNFEEIYEEHIRSWKREWDEIGFELKGDEDFYRAVIFNLFHLLALYNEESDVFILPARGLHGFGYRGHVFWDADIYALPFYLFFKPKAAKALLEYRYKNLNSAKENSRIHGFAGAQYPWESTDDGLEATPKEVPLDMNFKNKALIETGELEQHITADVAYAVDFYYRFSKDDHFMRDYGLRIIFETTRFWASRVEYARSKKAYVINDVIGPDEYHVHVNNSFYTNLLAKHNLELGIRYYDLCKSKEDWKDIVSDISYDEVRKWKEIKDNLYFPSKVDGVYEEFDGYFSLEDFILPDGSIGEFSINESARSNIGKNKLIKQADVVMALFLLKEKFSKEEIERNYLYYLPRTTHGSSLSLPSYAAVAGFLGRISEAYQMLKIVSNADLKNVYGNTNDGFHVASAGGLWIALLLGLLKLDIDEKGEMKLDPLLPQEIKEIKLNLHIRGKKYSVFVDKDKVLLTEINK